MGIGDELMMAGEARRQAAGTARKYLLLDKKGRPRWHLAWEGNPNVARPGETCDGVIGYLNGHRHYIAEETPERRTFHAYRPQPAHIELNARAKELAQFAAGAVVFNPTVKDRAPINKLWPLDYWKQLTLKTAGVRWLHIGEPGGPRIRGVESLITCSFMEACGVIAGAAAVVVHEGALHHAAAALGTPAVVIRGGFISPAVTGYAGQVDLYIEDERYPLGCGMRVPCLHCEQAMAAIKPERVASALRELLQKKVSA